MSDTSAYAKTYDALQKVIGQQVFTDTTDIKVQIQNFVRRHTIWFTCICLIPLIVIIITQPIAYSDIASAGTNCPEQQYNINPAQQSIIATLACIFLFTVVVIGLLWVYDSIIYARMMDLYNRSMLMLKNNL
jgi:hypothetical protein